MNLTQRINKRPYLAALVIFAVTYLVYYLTGDGEKTPYHYFVPLADAFLHGRTYLVENISWLNELIYIEGRYYVIYPPMPALLLLPQVAVSGMDANQTLASVFWGSLNAVLVFFMMRRITDNVRLQIWMTVLFGFGTIHWYLASLGKAWFFAHVTSFFFLTAAIIETLGKKRALLVGLLLGASFWCRLPVIMSAPFFLIMLSDLWLKSDKSLSPLKRINYAPLLKFGIGVGLFIILNFAYNYVRFGSIFDILYTIQAEREPWFYEKGLFHISYIPGHLWTFFLKPPVFSWEAPYVIPDYMGMSILITTPAFIYSVAAGIKNKLAVASWIAIVLIASVLFTHGGVGWKQFGYRFAVDFYPFLLILTALGIKKHLRADLDLTWDQKVLICISVLVNLWGVIWINKFGWVI